MYLDGDVQTNRSLLGFIFREKLLFDGKKYGTTRLNETAALIFHITKNLCENENRKDTPHAQLSGEVVPTIEKTIVFVNQIISNKSGLIK